MENNIKTTHKEKIRNMMFSEKTAGYVFETQETIFLFKNMRRIIFNKNKEYQLKIYFYRDIFNETVCFEYGLIGFNRKRFIPFSKDLLSLYYYFYCKGFYDEQKEN